MTLPYAPALSRPALVAGLVLLAGVGCSRAKVRLAEAGAAAPPVHLVVIPPAATLGLAELGQAAHMDGAGAALEDAAGRLAEGVGKASSKAAQGAAEKLEGKVGGKLGGTVLQAGAGLGQHAEKKRGWFEAAFSGALGNEARVTVVDPLLGLAAVDCDYRLRFTTSAGKGGAVRSSGKLYGAALGRSKTKGDWTIERCGDGAEVATGAMTHTRTFRWWMLDFFDRYRLRLAEDPIGAMAADHEAAGTVHDRHRTAVANIEGWRAAGAAAAPGAKLAGLRPKESGDYASPVRADGTLARWDNRALAGELAGAAVEEATRAGLQKVTGSGKLGKTVADVGGGLAGGLTSRAITKKLDADHHFDDACALAVWIDAAYAHRPDYRDVLRATTAVYPELETGFAGCLVAGATATTRPPKG